MIIIFNDFLTRPLQVSVQLPLLNLFVSLFKVIYSRYFSIISNGFLIYEFKKLLVHYLSGYSKN